jgi:hypothetical protein
MKSVLLASILFSRLILGAGAPQEFLGDGVEVYTSDEDFLAKMYPDDDNWEKERKLEDFFDDDLTEEQIQRALELHHLEKPIIPDCKKSKKEEEKVKFDSSDSEEMSNSEEFSPSFPSEFYSGLDSQGKKLPDSEVQESDLVLQSNEMKALEKKESLPEKKEAGKTLGAKKSIKLITFTLGDENLSEDELREKMKKFSLENHDEK